MINNVIIIIIYVFIGSVFFRLPDRNTYKRKKQYVGIVSILLILQSALRNLAVGDDTYGYYTAFIAANNKYTYSEVFSNFLNYYNGSIGSDFGYIFMEKFFSDILGGNFRIFLFLVAILFFISLGKFILNNTRKLSDIVVAYTIYSALYFSFYSITGIRQTIAMAIVMFAIPYIKSKNIFKFLLLVFIAFTIHKSAIIFILFYAVNRFKRLGKYLFLFALFLFPIAMSFKGQMLAVFQVIIGSDSYSEYEGAGTLTFTLLFLLVSILTYWKRNFFIQNNVNSSFFFSALALCLVLLPLSWINPSLIRIIMYFSIYLLVVIPEILNSFSPISVKLSKDLKIVSIILLVILYMKSNSEFQYGYFWDDMRLNKHYFQR
nr:EpsG family protein [Elizabethkingia sp. ASV34]